MTRHFEETKEYLRRYEYANARALRYKAEYKREHELIGSISINYDGMPRGSGISRKTERDALRLSEKAMKWKEAELDAIHERQEIFELICDIDGIEGQVLYERYINLHKWEEICVLLHYSWQGIHVVHKRALAIVESRLK